MRQQMINSRQHIIDQALCWHNKYLKQLWCLLNTNLPLGGFPTEFYKNA